MRPRNLLSVARSVASFVLAATAIYLAALPIAMADGRRSLDEELSSALARQGFTGTIEAQFRRKLGRPIDQKLADLGRMLWFDIVIGLNNDNTCGGCHSPTNGFGTRNRSPSA